MVVCFSLREGTVKQVQSVCEESHVIHSYEVDVHGRALPHVLFSYMLNSAWNHVFETEFNYENLAERGQFWALARFFLLFFRRPQWNEEIVVATWGKDIDRLYALRDFSIHSHHGEKLASATSSWLILDAATYRPQKLTRLREHFPFQWGMHELDMKLGKVSPLENEEEASRFTVHFSDIDVNRHVNAARYMQWMLDSCPFSVQERRDLKSCELNFIAEAKPGDEITVLVGSGSNADRCSVRRVSDNRELCRSELVWR
jgi:acyl-ACP thioesterase